MAVLTLDVSTESTYPHDTALERTTVSSAEPPDSTTDNTDMPDPVFAPAFELAPDAFHHDDAPPLPEAGRRRSRGRMVVIGVALVAVLVAGVIVVTTRDRKARTLAESAVLTQQQKTARLAMTMTLPLPGASDKAIDVTGGIDFTTQAAEFQIDLGSVLAGQLDGVPAGTDLTSTFVLKGHTEYMRIPLFDEVPSLKGKWVTIDTAKLTKQAGVDLGQLDAPRNNDPAQALDILTKKAKSITTIGSEKVRGVSTTHRKVVINLEDVFRSKGAVIDEKAFQKMLALYSTPDLTLDVWTDGGDLVRKLTETLPLKARPLTFSIEYFDFGVPVKVTIPNSADTVDIAALSQLTN